jgi:hypothetical protein
VIFRFFLKRSYSPILFYLAFITLFIYAILIQKNLNEFTLVFCVLAVPYFTFFIYNSLFPRVYVNKKFIYIRSEYFHKTSVENIFLDHIKIIKLSVPTEFSPRFQLFGLRTWLPSYRSGWMNLASNRPAFFAVSDLNKVIYIPTESGPDLLLSLENPEAFIAALKEAHANT